MEIFCLFRLQNKFKRAGWPDRFSEIHMDLILLSTPFSWKDELKYGIGVTRFQNRLQIHQQLRIK